jgi:hypothetical protein
MSSVCTSQFYTSLAQYTTRSHTILCLQISGSLTVFRYAMLTRLKILSFIKPREKNVQTV